MKKKTQKNELYLDPCMARQLDETPVVSEKTQWYLDNPWNITTYMDFRVDYAFKYILGHKSILLKLLNDILPIEVSDLEYLMNEIPVISQKEKRAVFDVICTQKETGEQFVIEMQRLGDLDMDDRLVFYGSSLLHNQIKRSDKSYTLKPVYVICIADYIRKHEGLPIPDGKLLFHYTLQETTIGDCLGAGKLQFFILELPRLQKVWDSLDENIERWCYLFENLHTFVQLPDNVQGFGEVFEIAQTGQLEDFGLLNYLNSMITDYEWYTYTEYARREGLEEGRAEGMAKGMEKVREIALKLMQANTDIQFVSDITGLSIEELNNLKQN